MPESWRNPTPSWPLGGRRIQDRREALFRRPLVDCMAAPLSGGAVERRKKTHLQIQKTSLDFRHI